MKAAQDIILKPVITEASMSGIADRKYSDKRHFFCQQNPYILLTSEFVLYIIALVSYR